MEEVWKDIPEYEGLYQVSNTGKVRRLNYRGSGKTKLLKQSTDKGYKRIVLSKNGKKKNHWVHRLVAIVFISNPNNYKEVNHKDENPSNNNVKNLEWCTREYNNNYGTRNKRASESHKGKCKGKDHPKSKPILMYDKEGNFIRQFDCISDTNEYFSKKNAYKNVNSCLTGKNKTAYGYVFAYIDDDQDTIKKKISKANRRKTIKIDRSSLKSILMYDKEGNFIRRFDCVADANEYFGKDKNCSSIKSCLTGRMKTAYGYVFKYEKMI